MRKETFTGECKLNTWNIFCHYMLFLLEITGLNLHYCLSDCTLSDTRTTRSLVCWHKAAKPTWRLHIPSQLPNHRLNREAVYPSKEFGLWYTSGTHWGAQALHPWDSATDLLIALKFKHQLHSKEVSVSGPGLVPGISSLQPREVLHWKLQRPKWLHAGYHLPNR